jgi:hypothetical protein
MSDEINSTVNICIWCSRIIPGEWIGCSDAGEAELRELAASPNVDPVCSPILQEHGYGSTEPGAHAGATAS